VSTSEDVLDRSRFADMVASRIDGCALEQPSTVFGLVGPWGSGKSSLINLIHERLGDGWKVATFSPWAAPNSNGLSYEFLAALSSTLDGKGSKFKAARKAVTEYLKLGTPFLNLIPVAGGAVEGFANKGLDAVTAGKPWQAEFEAVSKVLLSLGHRVLIIADDIDRLDAAELLSFLKVVRLLGRFPNVHYLIAYDQATVEDLLKYHGIQGRTSAFMEKIVQYPFEVPPIAGVAKRRLLTETVEVLLTDNDIDLKESDAARGSELIAILAPALATPRAHSRFREQLMSYAAMLSFREIDVLDFIALTFLRVFHHDVFDVIPVWKEDLQSGKRRGSLTSSEDMTGADWGQQLEPLVRNSDTATPQSVLSFLFPEVLLNGYSYNAEHERALSNDNYFQRYFVLGVADDDIEDALVETAVEKILHGTPAVDEVARLAVTLDSHDAQLAALAYEKCEKLRPRGVDPSVALVEFLLHRIQHRRGEEASSLSPAAVLWRWFTKEMFSAMTHDLVDMNQVLTWLGEDETVWLLMRIQRDRNNPANQIIRIFKDFAVHYRQQILLGLPGILETRGRLITLLTLLVKADGQDSIVGILDEPVGQDGAVFTDVIGSLVGVNEWMGGSTVEPELVFHKDLFNLAFSLEERTKHLALLPESRPLSEIDNENTDPANINEYGIAYVKALYTENLQHTLQPQDNAVPASPL
jgi:hypothetical protein